MAYASARGVVRALALAGVIALLGAGAVAQAGARPSPGPTVDVQPFASLAPDGRSIGVQVLASCPERWTVVEASVSVVQPQTSGRASVPLSCSGSPRMFAVAVPAASGLFELRDAQVSATVVIERGKTRRAQDAEVLAVDPTVLVELGDSAALEAGGGAVVLAVTVACPAGTTGLESRLVVSQGQALGVGTYVPACDGARHTFPVRVETSRGAYEPGIAQALTFADIEHDGTVFSGVDDDGALEIASS